jgi:hypothetical protein
MKEQYPEHEKMKAHKRDADVIAPFLEWLFQDIRADICQHKDERYMCGTCGEIPKSQAEYDRSDGTYECGECEDEAYYLPAGYYEWRHGGIEKILANYLGIDLQKVENEKQLMLAVLRGEVTPLDEKERNEHPS